MSNNSHEHQVEQQQVGQQQAGEQQAGQHQVEQHQIEQQQAEQHQSCQCQASQNHDGQDPIGQSADSRRRLAAELTAKELGARGEEAARKYLDHLGYRILERNWRCRAGEADLIAIDNGDLVFVEVKTRSGIDVGFPEEAVTREKRRRYEKIALEYLCANSGIGNTAIRFDVISIMLLDRHRAALRHHCNAFGGGN